jgi:hypothetical protein
MDVGHHEAEVAGPGQASLPNMCIISVHELSLATNRMCCCLVILVLREGWICGQGYGRSIASEYCFFCNGHVFLVVHESRQKHQVILLSYSLRIQI